jgi:ABC-type transport system substrate-binding protein
VFLKLAISCLVALLALPAMARTRPHYGGTLRVATTGDPLERPGGVARRLIFDGMTETAADETLRPALAVAWWSENADHRWQFRLRPGVQFHDGSPLTSVAVASSLMASCALNCPWGSVRAAGASVVFTADVPIPNLPAILAADEFLIANLPASGTDGGTGPFQITGQANGVLSLAANESCWAGRPFVDAVEIRAHRSINDQWLDLSADRADVVEVPAENIRLAQQQHFALAVSPPVEILALELTQSGALANPNLRGAIAAVADRSVLANVVFQKQGVPSAALLPQTVSGFAFLFPPDRGLNKANELRGGIAPPPLSLAAGAGATSQLAAQRIALDLREAGFKVQLAPAGTRLADLVLRTFRLPGADAGADLAEILRQAGQAPPNIGANPDSLYKAERSILEQNVIIPLVHLPRAYAFGSRVRDFRLRSDGSPDLASASLEAAP